MAPILSDPLQSEYELLVVTPFLIENQVECTVVKEYGSKLDERPDLQLLVDKEWNKMRELHPFLYNQSKFRYDNASYDENSTVPFHLYLGLTDYKSYIGSNMSSEWKTFLQEGERIGSPTAYFGNPLGNISVIVLRNGKHVLMQRGFNVAEAQGRLTCVGGHPEPLDINIKEYADVDALPPHAVRSELFASMKREVNEEMNIPISSIAHVYALGVEASALTHGRQVQLFCCFVDLTEDEFLEAYRQGPVDKFESTGLVFLSLDEVVHRINTDPNSMSCEARGLYSAFLSVFDTFKEKMDLWLLS